MAETATRAITSLAHHTPLEWGIEGPSFCHGTAGVLRCATTAPTTAHHAAKALTEAFDTRHTFGFQHVHQGQATDDPGLLTGAAGIALTLADYAELPTPNIRTQWDALLLLS